MKKTNKNLWKLGAAALGGGFFAGFFDEARPGLSDRNRGDGGVGQALK